MRLIHHLSDPKGHFINDFIDPRTCLVHYSSINEAANAIASLGTGALLGKSDIKSSFRLIPKSPSDFELLGFKVQEKYISTKCYPSDLQSAAQYGKKFGKNCIILTMANNIQEKPTSFIIQTPFFFCGPQLSTHCANTLSHLGTLCLKFGIPIADDKTVEPTSNIGFKFKTLSMTMSLPSNKVHTLQETIHVVHVLQATKVTIQQLESLMRLLNFSCRVVAHGRAFYRCLINATIGFKKKKQTPPQKKKP